jgi:hypothetical protein
VTLFVGTAERTNKVKLLHGALVGLAALVVPVAEALAEPDVAILTEPNVVRFPSMEFVRLTVDASTPDVDGVMAPNKNTDVCPACAPTPPSLFPAESGPVAAGVTIEPTKNLPPEFIAVAFVVVTLNVTAPGVSVASSKYT